MKAAAKIIKRESGSSLREGTDSTIQKAATQLCAELGLSLNATACPIIETRMRELITSHNYGWQCGHLSPGMCRACYKEVVLAAKELLLAMNKLRAAAKLFDEFLAGKLEGHKPPTEDSFKLKGTASKLEALLPKE